jgi:hypothetical protein
MRRPERRHSEYSCRDDDFCRPSRAPFSRCLPTGGCALRAYPPVARDLRPATRCRRSAAQVPVTSQINVSAARKPGYSWFRTVVGARLNFRRSTTHRMGLPPAVPSRRLFNPTPSEAGFTRGYLLIAAPRLTSTCLTASSGLETTTDKTRCATAMVQAAPAENRISSVLFFS